MEGPIAWVDGQYLGGAPGWEPEVRWTPWIYGRTDKNVWSKKAGLGRDDVEGSGQSLPRTDFLCQVTQLSLLRWQEALQTVCFLALCRWHGRFIRPGEEQWPDCYLFMISNSRVHTWYRGGGANRGADTTLTPSTFTWPDCVSATCPPSVTMSAPAGAPRPTEVAPRAAPFIFAGGSADVFDTSICYPAKEGPHSSKQRGEK